MAYQVGDSPAEPLHVTSYSVDISRYAMPIAVLVAPGVDINEPTGPEEEQGVQLVSTIEGDEVVVEFERLDGGIVSPQFDRPGIWRVLIVLLGGDQLTKVRTLPGVRFVVESLESEWHTVTTARDADWADARDMDDMTLYELLESAKHDVLEFAPALAEGEPLPVNYRMAQLMHARNRYNAALADPTTGDIGAESFAIPARPLDWQIKQLLRPSRGIPAGW